MSAENKISTPKYGTCPECGSEKVEYLPTRGRCVCGECFALLPDFLGRYDDHHVPMPTPEQIAAIDRDLKKGMTSGSLKSRAEYLYLSGDYRTPAEAAKAIGYDWTEQDQSEFKRDTYIPPEKIDALKRRMDAIRTAREEGRF